MQVTILKKFAGTDGELVPESYKTFRDSLGLGIVHRNKPTDGGSMIRKSYTLKSKALSLRRPKISLILRIHVHGNQMLDLHDKST